MNINRLFCNRYTMLAQCLLRNIQRYGAAYTRSMLRRDKMTDYTEFKNSFGYSPVFDMIEEKAGNDFYIKAAFDMGYCVYGPLIYDFVKWLEGRSEKYTRLLFLSREGWLLKKVYDICCPKGCPAVYFLTSRRSASVAAIENENDIKDILSIYYKGSFKNLMYARFGVEIKGEDMYVEMPRNRDNVFKRINVHHILYTAAKERRIYRRYCENIIDSDSTAVVDVGYSGTIQLYLSRLTDREIDGLYMSFLHNGRALKSGCRCESLFPVENTLDETRNKVFKNQLYLEAVLKAPFGQLICFDENDKPIYDNDNSFDSETEEIQRGICAFARDMTRERYSPFNSLSAELFDFALRNGRIEASLLKPLFVEDSYCSGKELRLQE